jgi:hypothetical protein
MALRIDTFDNVRGGNALYKALAHPHAAAPARALVAALAVRRPTAIVDPQGAAVAAFAEMFALDGVEIAGIYVQEVARIGASLLGYRTRPLTELADSGARSVLVAAFDAERLIGQLQPFLPQGAEIFSLDAMRLPAARLSNRRSYLDPLNFATNFAFFRDTGALHTRLVTANYWSAYGASEASTLWLTLFDGDGAMIAEWSEPCGDAGAAIFIDSREVRRRFGLGDFAGQLFVHIAGAAGAGHDIVKYALDMFGNAGGPIDGGLSCTHDANAWPAERYAGLPAPGLGERVILWVQNSHPTPIPAGAIGLNPMGEEKIVALPEAIGPFASRAVDVGELLPGLSWPRQIEIRAGKHVVRPRYEIVAGKRRRRIAHVNVERGDLRPDPELPRLAEFLGKGYLLPAPILPPRDWESLVLPTPMAVSQAELPIAALVYDAAGSEIARLPLGCLMRDHATALSLDSVAAQLGDDGYGHVELVFDFAEGGSGDGWLHAIFRYRHRRSGHAAETSFGAHVFNTIMVYRGEPQSYSGRPPGLSTRLFLRLGEEPYDTLCHLIYPASRQWRPHSATEIILHDRAGTEIARAATLAIPCSGSRLLRYHALFDVATRRRAGGSGAYAIVSDPTCRLFGYHGLLGRDGAFSLDHMFGF